jgi:hypothetical protein
VFDRLLVVSIVPCSFGAWLEELDQESRANMETALWTDKDSPSYKSHASIVAAIADEAKKNFDPETISAHRKGECRCSRD